MAMDLVVWIDVSALNGRRMMGPFTGSTKFPLSKQRAPTSPWQHQSAGARR